MRRDGPPTSVSAEFTATRAGRSSADLAAGRQADRLPQDSGRREAGGAVDLGRRERLAVGARLGSALREPLLGLDRDAVRRAHRSVAGLPPAAPGAARSGAQLPLRLPRPARGRSRRTRRRSRRRPTAPTCRTSCAPTSPGSSGCRSGSATATAGPNRGRRAARRSTATTTRRPGKDTLAAVKSFFRQLANRVQSGSARTGLDDDATDYYPVPLERAALRPGVDLRRSVRPRDGGGEVGRPDGRQGRPAAGRRRPARHVDRAQALLGGDVPVRERRQERGPRLQGVPPAGARRRRQAGADRERGDRRQGAIRRTRRSPTSRRRSRRTASTRAWAS